MYKISLLVTIKIVHSTNITYEDKIIQTHLNRKQNNKKKRDKILACILYSLCTFCLFDKSEGNRDCQWNAIKSSVNSFH